VRFVPESEKEVPPALTECQGGKTVIEEGQFVGQISFRGEHGYTRVRAHHAIGTITKSPELTCNSKVNPKREKATERAGEKAKAGSEPELDSEAVGLKARDRAHRLRSDRDPAIRRNQGDLHRI
jgi:hypothetical protein